MNFFTQHRSATITFFVILIITTAAVIIGCNVLLKEPKTQTIDITDRTLKTEYVSDDLQFALGDEILGIWFTDKLTNEYIHFSYKKTYFKIQDAIRSNDLVRIKEYELANSNKNLIIIEKEQPDKTTQQEGQT